MSKKILIIDDATETVSLLESILQGQGYSVTSAHNGKDALAKLQKERPALIVLDILMPEMDGFALYKALKQERGTSTIPILILTVRARMEETFRALGVEEFLAKPFEGQQLLDRVSAILGDREKSAMATATMVAATSGAATTSPTATATMPREDQSTRKMPGVKKVLLVGSSPDVIATMKRILLSANCETEIVANELLVVEKFLKIEPDIVVLEVLMNNRPTVEVIKKIKQIPKGVNKPIILFSFLDKERLKETSIHQKALAIESARAACLKAGASDSIGGFEETHFMHAIKKYL